MSASGLCHRQYSCQCLCSKYVLVVPGRILRRISVYAYCDRRHIRGLASTRYRRHWRHTVWAAQAQALLTNQSQRVLRHAWPRCAGAAPELLRTPKTQFCLRATSTPAMPLPDLSTVHVLASRRYACWEPGKDEGGGVRVLREISWRQIATGDNSQLMGPWRWGVQLSARFRLREEG